MVRTLPIIYFSSRCSYDHQNCATLTKENYLLLYLLPAVEEELRQRLHLESADQHQNTKDERSPPMPLQSNFAYRKVGVVILLLILISLVAAAVANLFEYLGYVEKKDKKQAHVV